MDTEYLKKVGLYIVSAILSLCIIIYFGYHIVSTFTPEVKTETVVETTVTKTFDSEGYIFRDEAVINSKTAGVVVPSVGNGEKVKAYGEVAGIYSEAAVGASEKLREIDTQIALLTECTRDNTVSLKDAALLDDEMYSLMTQIRIRLDRGDTDAAEALRSELISVSNKKSLLMGQSGDIGVRISELQGERSQIVSSLGQRYETVTSPYSGYYYTSPDGYEDAFSVETLLSGDYAEISRIIDSPERSENYGIGKIVRSSEWYVALRVTRGIGSLLTEGETRSISFTYNDNISISMKLERLIRYEDGYLCVFSTLDMPEDFEYTRSQPVKLSLSAYKGFKVRISDVRKLDGEMGVYVLDGSIVRFKLISVIVDHEGYYIVETNPDTEINEETAAAEEEGEESEKQTYGYLSLHDLIITEGTGLYDGRILGK